MTGHYILKYNKLSASGENAMRGSSKQYVNLDNEFGIFPV